MVASISNSDGSMSEGTLLYVECPIGWASHLIEVKGGRETEVMVRFETVRGARA